MGKIYVMPTWSDLANLAHRVVDGDESAMEGLWTGLDHELSARLRKQNRYGWAARNEDAVRDIVLATIERLRKDDERLRDAFARGMGATGFQRLVYWMLRNVAADYRDHRGDYLRPSRGRNAANIPSGWVAVDELDSTAGSQRPPYTNRATALDIIEAAGRPASDLARRAFGLRIEGRTRAEIAGVLDVLESRVDELLAEIRQRAALILYADDVDYDEIAAILELEGGAASAERLVRAAKESARRRLKKGAG